MKIKTGKIHTVSNYLSFLRLLLAIPVYYLLGFIFESYNIRIIIFVLLIFAGITDYLDGLLARKLGNISEIGKILDPLADKILVGAIVIRLYYFQLIPDYYFWIVIFRDILILAGGIILSKYMGKIFPSNLLGKMTFVATGAFISGLILEVEKIKWLHDFLLYSSLILSILSIAAYALRAKELIRWKKNESL